MMHFESGERQTITYMKAVGISLVVFGHCLSYYGMHSDLGRAFKLVEHLSYTVNVPIFIIIAGFLCHKQDLIVFHKKKIKRVLVPFWMFSMLKILYSLLTHEVSHGSSLFELIIDAYLLGNTYWFAYSIYLMFITAPAFWAEKKIGSRQLYSGFVLLFLIVFNCIYYKLQLSFLPSIFQFHNFVKYLPYFLIGHIVSVYWGKTLKNTIQAYRTTIFVVSLIIIICESYAFFLDSYRVQSYFINLLTSLALFMLLLMLVSKIKVPIAFFTMLGNYSWQIMMLDSFFHVVLFKLAFRFAYSKPECILMITILDLALSVLCSKCCEKIPYIRFLFGL